MLQADRKILLFAIINIIFLAVVIIIWLGPTARSALRASEHVNFLENRYVVLSRAAAAYESNLTEQEQMNQANRLLTYCQVVPTASDITRLIGANNLESVRFDTGESVGVDTYALGQLREHRIRMISVGTFNNSVIFLKQLKTMPVVVTEIDVGFGESITMDIELLLLSDDQ